MCCRIGMKKFDMDSNNQTLRINALTGRDRFLFVSSLLVEHVFSNWWECFKHRTHRYKIYVEGVAWSVSRKYILACDSPTLLVKDRYYDFFSRSLLPIHHFWPISSDYKCPSIKFAVDWGNNHPQKVTIDSFSFSCWLVLISQNILAFWSFGMIFLEACINIFFISFAK